MQRQRKSIFAALLIILTSVGIVVACWYFGIGTTQSGLQIGYVEHTGKHHWDANYVQFHGTMWRTMYAEDDTNLLHIEGNTQKGSLGIVIKNQENEVIFSEPNLANQTFEIETPDRVKVELKGEKHKGSFDLHYQPVESVEPIQPEERIFLYGQEQSTESILEKEFEIWEKYYKEDGMRHLFVALPYYTAAFLNIWMKEQDNKILNALYDDWQGIDLHSEPVRRFYHKIKEHCPETIFHGIDVGHEYATTGMRYLNYLRTHGMEGSKEYTYAEQAIEQGKRYYDTIDEGYRENMMTENFMRTLDSLGEVKVMGIYSTQNCSQEIMDVEGNVIPCMASQLKEYYGDAIQVEELSLLGQADNPIGTDQIKVGEKEYEATYFGMVNMSAVSPEFRYREFWRLEDAYADFQKYEKTQNVLPYESFPMRVEQGQVLVVDYVKADGTNIRQYYRTDGTEWHGTPAAEEIIVYE